MFVIALGSQLPRPLTALFSFSCKVNLSGSPAISGMLPSAPPPRIRAWAALPLASLSSLKGEADGFV